MGKKYPDSDIPNWCKMPMEYHHDEFQCMFIQSGFAPEWNCVLSCIWHKDNENLQEALDDVSLVESEREMRDEGAYPDYLIGK